MQEAGDVAQGSERTQDDQDWDAVVPESDRYVVKYGFD
jgi:hypothetical protein